MSRVAVLRRPNPLTPMSDQDRISPYDINTISSRQVMSNFLLKLPEMKSDFTLTLGYLEQPSSGLQLFRPPCLEES